MALGDALAYYQELFLAGRNFADATRVHYGRDLRQLLTYLEGPCLLSSPGEVQRRHLEGFLARLDQQGLAGSSRRRKVASIRSFFAFLEEQGLIAASPARKLLPPERARNQPRVLSEAEYKRLLEAVRYEPRDAAMIELLLQTGMRLSELARLRLTDVELPPKVTRDAGNVGRVTVQGKGRRTRTITLNWKACKALKAYLAVRPDVDYPQVFLTKFRKPIGPRSIENVVTKYLREARIHDASVHTLRHTFATHMVRRGTKLDVVRQALGHADLKTTSIYVELAREVMDEELQRNAL